MPFTTGFVSRRAVRRTGRVVAPRRPRWCVPRLLALVSGVTLAQAAGAQQPVTPPALPDIRVPPAIVPAEPEPDPAAPGAPTLPWRVAVDVTLPAAPAASPVIAAGLLVVPLRSAQLLAVSLADGHVRWTTALPLPALLAVAADLVIAAEPGAIVARRADSGDTVWRVPVAGAVTALGASTVGLVVAGLEGGLVAVQHGTGAVAWRVDTSAPVTRVLATDTGAVAGLSSGAVVAIAPSGVVRWTQQLPGSVTALGFARDEVFAGSTDNYLYTLKADDGAIDWRWRTGGDITGTPVVAGRRVLFVSLDTVLRALDTGNGAQQWKRGLASRPIGGPLVVEDTLIVTGVGPVAEGFAVGTGRPLGRLVAGRELIAPLAAWRDEAGATSLVALSRAGEFQRYERKASAAPAAPPVSAPPPSPGPPAPR